MLSKLCSRCLQEKPVEAFCKNAKGRFGRYSLCRGCQNAAGRAAFATADKAVHCERVKRWQRRNHTKHLAQSRERRLANPEATRTRDSVNNLMRRARLIDAAEIERVDRLELLRRNRYRCGICGFSLWADDFHVDHIVPLSRGGTHTYSNTQPACPECNEQKHDKILLSCLLVRERIAADNYPFRGGTLNVPWA